MIRLEPVSPATFKRVVDMKLSEEQSRFVAPNVVSLAQAWLYYDEARPFAVMNGDEVVGFIMLDWDEAERSVGIWRFMIAPEHQHKGYGRAAILAAIELARSTDRIDMMHLDYVPGNEGARELYHSLGFNENGMIEQGEIVMTLPLTDDPKVGKLTADMEDFDDIFDVVEAQSGELPSLLADKESLQTAIENNQISRLTLMGETIGFVFSGKVYLLPAQKSRLDEINSLLEK